MKVFLTNTLSNTLYKMLIDGLKSYGLLVDYCNVLLVVWMLILMAPIHYRDKCNAKFLQIFSDEETHLHLECPERKYIFSKWMSCHEHMLQLFMNSGSNPELTEKVNIMVSTKPDWIGFVNLKKSCNFLFNFAGSDGSFLNNSFILNESLMWLGKNESSRGVIRSVAHAQHPIGSALN